MSVFSRVRKKLRATCIVMVPAPCWVPAARLASAARSHAHVVDPAVLVEALVLGRQDRVSHDIRDLPDADDRAPFLAEFAQEVAFRRDDAQGNLGLVVGQRLQRGQRGLQQRQDERAQQRADDRQAERYRSEIDDPAL